MPDILFCTGAVLITPIITPIGMDRYPTRKNAAKAGPILEVIFFAVGFVTPSVWNALEVA